MDKKAVAPRILVAEDEGLVAMSIRRYLTKIGYEVVNTVSTGQDAVDQAESLRPDLVLMDIRLEGSMDGIEAADKIRAAAGIPVVYLTSYSDEGTLKRAKLTEPFGYVMKPFDQDMLRVTVEMALYKAEMHRRLRQAKEELETTLRSLDEGVIVTDETGHVAYMNAAATRLLGRPPIDSMPRPELREVFRLFDSESHDAIDLPLDQVTRLGERTSMRNVLLAVAGDRRMPVDFSLLPLAETATAETATAELQKIEPARGIVVAFRDITDRRNAERLVEGEQQRATELYQSLLPQDGMVFGGVHMRRFFRSAATASGDIFNFFAVDDTHAVLYIIDVVGHGISAAAVSVLLHRLLSPSAEARSHYPILDVDARSPTEVVQQLNRLFYVSSQDLFFTILYAVIDTESGVVRFTRGGHSHPIRQRNDGTVQSVSSEEETGDNTVGMAVGIAQSMNPVEQQIKLGHGERLFLYTDGLIDCMNRNFEQYSLARLLSQIEAQHGKSLKEVISALESDVSEWAAPDVSIDDISLIAIEYH